MANSIYEAREYVRKTNPEVYEWNIRMGKEFGIRPVWEFMFKDKNGKWKTSIHYRWYIDAYLLSKANFNKEGK